MYVTGKVFAPSLVRQMNFTDKNIIVSLKEIPALTLNWDFARFYLKHLGNRT